MQALQNGNAERIEACADWISPLTHNPVSQIISIRLCVVAWSLEMGSHRTELLIPINLVAALHCQGIGRCHHRR